MRAFLFVNFMPETDNRDAYRGAERRRCPLTEEQVEMFRQITHENAKKTAEEAAQIAIEKSYPKFKEWLVRDVSASFGQLVIRKAVVIVGVVLLGAWALLTHFNIIKGP